jgi:4-amino-4-deoxy-L-arabinose transferase-like glycosyltransferase
MVTDTVVAPADDRRAGPSRPARAWLAVILGSAALFRFLWVLHAARPPKGLNDTYWYTVFAQQLAAGNGYALLDGDPTAYYPVGYPAVIGGVLWVARHTPLPDDTARLIGFFQLLLGVATVVLLFEVAWRLYDTVTALVAAAIVAFWPNLVFHTAVALSETLFNFLLLCAVLVVVWRPWHERLTTGRLAAFGALIGLATLVRPIALLLIPVAWFAWTRAGGGLRRPWRPLLVVVLATAAVIAPWTVRNVVRMNSPVLIATNLGDNLCMSRHPGATGGYDESEYCDVDFDPEDRPEYEIRQDRHATRRAIDYVVDHPLSEPKLMLWRTYFTLSHDHDGLQAAESYGSNRYFSGRIRQLLITTADGYYFAALGLGLLGFWHLRLRADPRRLFVIVSMVALAAPPLLFFGDARFHMPAVPFLAIPAALALLALIRGARRPQPAPP